MRTFVPGRFSQTLARTNPRTFTPHISPRQFVPTNNPLTIPPKLHPPNLRPWQLSVADHGLSVLSWMHTVELRVELSRDICMRRRTRCSVTTAPDDGSRMLEKLSLQQALEGAQRQFGGAKRKMFQVAGPNTAKLRWSVEVRALGRRWVPVGAERS